MLRVKYQNILSLKVKIKQFFHTTKRIFLRSFQLILIVLIVLCFSNFFVSCAPPHLHNHYYNALWSFHVLFTTSDKASQKGPHAFGFYPPLPRSSGKVQVHKLPHSDRRDSLTRGFSPPFAPINTIDAHFAMEMYTAVLRLISATLTFLLLLLPALLLYAHWSFLYLRCFMNMNIEIKHLWKFWV